jgi:hypothetical protein
VGAVIWTQSEHGAILSLKYNLLVSLRTESDHNSFEQRLEKDGTLASIADACDSGSTEYSVSDLGIPGLRHFIYKSRSQVQITVPMFEDPYDNMEDRRR